ncbi:hypothetical protein DL93DRAFT_340815 [Clavulina sp. PMI_390]|nr:hypothetical protein DL93DRAFT_340815 [Clavulina sp. PMI_390]
MESFASIASTILDAVDNLVAFRWPTIDEMPLLRFHNRLERNQAEQENNLALSEIADALSVVSNAKAKITALYDVLHHRQALLQQRSAPISALPNELLGDIFCLVSKHSQSSSSPWNLPRRGWVTSLWLSHVCQQWRSVAQANSPLWANLNVQTRRQGNLIPLFAQYSRLSRLRLLISGISARREDTGPMISLISAQARQISDLRISGYWIPGLLGYPEVMFDLESLTLQDSIVPSKDLEQFSATRHLRLEKAMVFRNGSHVLSMPNLTELVYENQSLAYIQMGIVLLDAPNLSRIQIIEEEPVGDDSDDGGPYQSDKILPSLRSLSIRNNLTVLWSLFPTIFENLCLGIRDLDLSVPLGFGGMPHILDGPRTGADLNRLVCFPCTDIFCAPMRELIFKI